MSDANDPGFVSEDEIAALKEERRFLEESPEDYGKRLLQENVGDAVLSLTKLAIHGSNETVRMNASKYIVERVLGKIQEFPDVDKAEWEKMLDASYIPEPSEAPTNKSNKGPNEAR